MRSRTLATIGIGLAVAVVAVGSAVAATLPGPVARNAIEDHAYILTG